MRTRLRIVSAVLGLDRRFTPFDPEAQQEALQSVYQLIASELQGTSKRRLQMEEELKLLRSELASNT